MTFLHNGETTTLRIESAAITFELADIQGLSFTANSRDYTNSSNDTEDLGLWQQEFINTVHKLEGQLLPYLAIQFKDLDTPINSHKFNRINIYNDDEDPCFSISVVIEDSLENKIVSLFYSDDCGKTEWVFASHEEMAGGNDHKFVFFIPRPERLPKHKTTKFPFGVGGKYIFRFVVWEMDYDLAAIEKKFLSQKRRYRLYHNYQSAGGRHGFTPFPAPRSHKWDQIWRRFDKKMGKTLLLIHGTRGTANIAFANLLRDKTLMLKLQQKYGDRIIAFNHPSLSKGVIHNAKKLRSLLKKIGNIKLDLDILSRSRGGLIARWLIEQGQLPDQVEMNEENKLVMLSAPHQGTPMSDPRNWLQALSVNELLKSMKKQKMLSLDDNITTDLFFDVSYVKAQEMLKRAKPLKPPRILPGAMDQRVGSDFLLALNHEKQKVLDKESLPKYYTLTNEFDASISSFSKDERLQNKLAKKLVAVFGIDSKNDGIVPVSGALMQMKEEPKSPNFHLHKSKTLQEPNIQHVNYFSSRAVREFVVESLLEK